MKSKIFTENDRQYMIIVKPELHYSKGNRAPHFAITGEIWKAYNGAKFGRDCISCGCIHDEIEKHFPGEFTDIITLHLSDNDGMPMYAVENGFYWYKQNAGKGFDYIRLPKIFWGENMNIESKVEFADLVDSLRPMCKEQAEACIKKHNLVVTGDKWGPKP